MAPRIRVEQRPAITPRPDAALGELASDIDTWHAEITKKSLEGRVAEFGGVTIDPKTEELKRGTKAWYDVNLSVTLREGVPDPSKIYTRLTETLRQLDCAFAGGATYPSQRTVIRLSFAAGESEDEHQQMLAKVKTAMETIMANKPIAAAVAV